MNNPRRTFLRGSLAGSSLALAAGAGLITPRLVLAEWPKSAFEARSVDDALSALLSSSETSDSGDITIKAPDIAENGAVVPVSVNSSIKGVKSITLIVEANGTPLSASFNLASNTLADISTRLKMGKTSNVIALVKTADKTYRAAKQVKVTIGGCGG